MKTSGNQEGDWHLDQGLEIILFFKLEDVIYASASKETISHLQHCCQNKKLPCLCHARLVQCQIYAAF